MKTLINFVAAQLIFMAGPSPAAEPLALRLMTYNIRLDLASDGENAWPHRRDWVVGQVQWLRPDIFGMQEVLPSQKADLIAGLPEYEVIGGGRDNGSDQGEASPIGFNTNRFDLLDSGLFWLSATPSVPSMGWDAAYKRVVTWARLRVHGTKQVLFAVNTHWDNEGTIARHESALQIAAWIKTTAKHCERVMLFGDFNSEMESEPLRNIRASLGLRDARAATKSALLGPAATFNDFKNPPVDSRAIDHFLLGEGIEVVRYAVISQLIDGRWPSDHFPVLVDVSVPECR
jgi:endonuclease/exonuclease/phosphatase family metal-dependent hydrolase